MCASQDFSPCELFQRIHGRTLWLMGDSQTWWVAGGRAAGCGVWCSRPATNKPSEGDASRAWPYFPLPRPSRLCPAMPAAARHPMPPYPLHSNCIKLCPAASPAGRHTMRWSASSESSLPLGSAGELRQLRLGRAAPRDFGCVGDRCLLVSQAPLALPHLRCCRLLQAEIPCCLLAARLFAMPRFKPTASRWQTGLMQPLH